MVSLKCVAYVIAASLSLHVSQATTQSDKRVVVVSGATGRTGLLLYQRLKAEGLWDVRAFVRNVTKAKATLNCSQCDESEGIFVGDVTDPASLSTVMHGADVLAITTSAAPHCSGALPFPPFNKCAYHKGAFPKDIDWIGTKNTVKAFASGPGSLQSKQILYVSTMETTRPDNFLDKLASGYTSFYHLQAEAFIMSVGIPYTITKACGLGDGAASKHKLIVGHDDQSFSLLLDHAIQRDDVARVLVEAVKNPAVAAGLRFDLCSQAWGKATSDISTDVLKAARYAWDHRAGQSAMMI